MALLVPTRSRLRFAELVSSDGVTFWNALDPPTIPQQTDDLKYTVRSSDRIDRIAYKFYGDPVLWWVIALANDLELLPTALFLGQVLTIPAPRYVLQQLFQTAKVK